MLKILPILFLLTSSPLFAIEFFQAGEVISADKINTIITDSMRVNEKRGTNTYGTTSSVKSLVTGRTVAINKKHNETSLLIKYSDVFRVIGQDKMCTIYLEIDGVACSNGENFKSIYMNYSSDINAIHLSAVCSGMIKGNYTAKVMVKNGAQYSGYTGGSCEFTWADNSTYSLTVQEVLGN